MKQILSLILALAMLCSLGSAAFAADTGELPYFDWFSELTSEEEALGKEKVDPSAGVEFDSDTVAFDIGSFLDAGINSSEDEPAEESEIEDNDPPVFFDAEDAFPVILSDSTEPDAVEETEEAAKPALSEAVYTFLIGLGEDIYQITEPMTIRESLTIPARFEVIVCENGVLSIAPDAVLSVEGTLSVTDEGDACIWNEGTILLQENAACSIPENRFFGNMPVLPQVIAEEAVEEAEEVPVEAVVEEAEEEVPVEAVVEEAEEEAPVEAVVEEAEEEAPVEAVVEEAEGEEPVEAVVEEPVEKAEEEEPEEKEKSFLGGFVDFLFGKSSSSEDTPESEDEPELENKAVPEGDDSEEELPEELDASGDPASDAGGKNVPGMLLGADNSVTADESSFENTRLATYIYITSSATPLNYPSAYNASTNPYRAANPEGIYHAYWIGKNASGKYYYKLIDTYNGYLLASDCTPDYNHFFNVFSLSDSDDEGNDEHIGDTWRFDSDYLLHGWVFDPGEDTSTLDKITAVIKDSNGRQVASGSMTPGAWGAYYYIEPYSSLAKSIDFSALTVGASYTISMKAFYTDHYCPNGSASVKDASYSKSWSYTFTLEQGTKELKIVGHPNSVSAAPGETARFSVAASGRNIQYQWQYKTSSGSWTNSSGTGYNTATLSFTAKTSFNGRQYRCKVSDGTTTVTSNPATLTVTEAPLSITTHPSNVTVTAGNKATFTVKASVPSGKTATYQWQYKTSSGSWTNSSGTGYNTATLSFTAKTSFNGRQYRCKVSDGTTTVTSNPATLTVTEAPLSITTHPSNVTVTAGNKATFTVKASVPSGKTATYQWQYKTSSGTWTNSSGSGYNTATLSFTAKTSFNGRQYRCKVSDGTTTVTSNPATLTVKEAPLSIITQPKGITVASGNKATFTIKVSVPSGKAATYQWQYKTSSGTWTNSSGSGYNTATLSFTAKTSFNGRQYRCKVSDGTTTLNSNAATLSIEKYSGVTPNTKLTRTNILKLLDAVDPDGAYIIRNSDESSCLEWFSDATTIGEGIDRLSTAVHEQCHDFTHNGGWYAELIYIGNGKYITVNYTDVFPTSEMVSTVPESLRTFRFDTYVNGDPLMSSIQDGPYGLLNEFTAYCWGNHNEMMIEEFKQEYGLNNGMSSNEYLSYAEFRYYILHYMLYAKDNYPEVYSGILNNTNFKRAFATIDNLFAEIAENQKNYFEIESWNALIAEMNKTKYKNMANLLKSY